jgi:hypothetical protein
VDISYISDSKLERHTVEDLPELLQRDQGVQWVDIPVCDADAPTRCNGPARRPVGT